MRYIINSSQKRYFGNLHCHSVRSDGESTVKELVEGYKDKGYHFLAITDHRRVYNKVDFDTENFILLTGMEMDTWIEPNRFHQFFHFQVIGDLPHDYSEETRVFDNYIDSMKTYEEYGEYLQILNHPHWSRMNVEYIKKLRPKFMEIYNHAAEVETACGYDLTTWDELLHRGIDVKGIAADDTHMKINQDHKVRDHFGGLVAVLSDSLDKGSIIQNIKDGNYYSKLGIAGPDFTEIKLDNGIVYVECTDVKKISFVAFNYHGKVVYRDEEPLRSAKFKSNGHKFVRIELEDDQGRKAWSNAIYFE